MPIGGERPTPPKIKGVVRNLRNNLKDTGNKETSKGFFNKNWGILLIFALIIIGSNLHDIFPGLGTQGKWNIYLFAQQMFGASVLFTFIYWRKVKREDVFHKSFAMAIFFLSVYCAIGEFFSMYGIDVFNQAKKGWMLFAEYAFLIGVFLTGIFFYRKNG